MATTENISRRSFLKIVLAVVGASAVGAVLIERWKVGFLSSLQALHHGLVDPVIKKAPTGVLSEQALKALLAVTQTLVDSPVETSHYVEFFQWRSQNLQGYKDVYEQFAFTVNHAAKQSVNQEFSDSETGVRLRILQKTRLAGRINRIQMGLFERDWLRFEKYIVREILEVFNRTDAWILLGYESWPGTARGLVEYREVPAKGEKSAANT
jgi:hypothetical protein